MNINTKYHGQVNIIEEDILSFEKGIPGFQDEKKFVILPLSEDGIFSVLQSTQLDYLAFVIANPFHFNKDYDFELEDAAIEELQLDSPKEVQVYAILTVHDQFEKTTANLQAPIIINGKNNKAKQVILNNKNYQTKHPIFQMEAKR